MTKKPTTLKIKPLADRIIVNDPKASEPKEDPTGQQMVGGIIIPDAAKGNIKRTDLNTAHHVVTALAVGEGCKLVKQGQKIVITDSGLFRVKVGDVTFCGVGEGNVVAVLG